MFTATSGQWGEINAVDDVQACALFVRRRRQSGTLGRRDVRAENIA
jgi:hypothetical protein